MKKLVLTFFTLYASLLQAQEAKDTTFSDNKNEIRIDVGKLLTATGFHISYDRFFNNDFSAGISVMLFDNNQNNSIFYDSNIRREYKIEPFVRYSISNSTKRFFYVEGFTSILGGSTRQVERYSDGVYGYYDTATSNFTSIALGTSIGYKFYMKKHFCFDFNLGFSSNIYDKTNNQALPKFGISTGYRF